MNTPILYPFKLAPSLHVKVWGGRKLQTVMNKPLPTDEPYGEAWELHDTAVITNGPLAGQTLADALAEYGTDLIGAQNDPREGFPLLAKIIDAEDWLSIQVHPNDEQARELENDPRGKTEAWLILAADEGAKLCIGVQPGTSREIMADAIRNNTLEDVLEYADVHAGDVFFVAANTIHALGPGILLYEIQQSSNITYRLYDWGRMGLDGKPREMHVEKGVQVSNVESLPELKHPEGATTVMVSCPYFETMRHTLVDMSLQLTTNGAFQALTCIDGTLTVTHGETTITLQKGETVLIPASLDAYLLVGTGTVLRSYQV
ncbi:MAG: class I mannose-6-phosphate isomerase [Anaerolineae bacterium]|nr:class I mannose-6-phosphate isomerase [Anaerolineae bacterium]MCA9888191.1 class I mannose-6-phosphate isomerase [Anaerolineae bacterium]